MQNIWGNLIPQVNIVNANEKFDEEFNEYVNKQLQINKEVESDSVENVQVADEVPVEETISEESVEHAVDEVPVEMTAKKKKSKKRESAFLPDIE